MESKMKIIKHLNTGEVKVECPNCLNRFRVDLSNLKCPICEPIKQTQIVEVVEINFEPTDIIIKEDISRVETELIKNTKKNKKNNK
jgi:hypothetical protein